MMGTISVNKLGGLSLIVGPIVALLGYFLQPGGIVIDAADPANAQEALLAITSNAGFSQVTGFVIPIGLIIFLYGFSVVQGNVKGNGNGDALARYGTLLLSVGIIGWVVSSGIANAIAGSDLQVASEAAAAGALYAATLGINTTSAILASLGFVGIALALSTRDDHNKIFALVIAVVSIVSLIAAVVGGVDNSQLQTMQTISGICYIVTTVWAITLGLALVGKE